MSGGRWQGHPFACTTHCKLCAADDARAAQAEEGHTPQPTPEPEPRTVRVAAGDLRPGDRVTVVWGRPSEIVAVRDKGWVWVDIVYRYDGTEYQLTVDHDRRFDVPVADLVECSEQAEVLTAERDEALAAADELREIVMDLQHRLEYERERADGRDIA